MAKYSVENEIYLQEINIRHTRCRGVFLDGATDLIEQLGVALVPYLVLLVVPLLGRMSDHNIAVRLMASQCFATLIRLIPLEVSQLHSYDSSY